MDLEDSDAGDQSELVDTLDETTPDVDLGLERSHPSSEVGSFDLPTAWWPIAVGAEVSSKPRAVRLGSRRLAIYRDRTGSVRAVDDRCPHRRLPLSMGRLTPEGDLQCRYHGWCFDGATGKCTAIPNLAPHERVSPGIKVGVYSVGERIQGWMRSRPTQDSTLPGEPLDDTVALTHVDAVLSDGFVFVWTGQDPIERSPSEKVQRDLELGLRTFSGQALVRASWERLSEAVFWNPGRALNLGVLLGTGPEQADADLSETSDTVSARRHRLSLNLIRVSSFDAPIKHVRTVNVTTAVDTGLTRVAGKAADGSVICQVVVALTPISPARTIVRWRGELNGVAASLFGGWYSGRRGLRRLVEHQGRPLESCVDALEDTVDSGVERLRERRRMMGIPADQK